MELDKTVTELQRYCSGVYQFSVIIPTFNEEKNIRRCIDSIKSCNYSEDQYEIILVDNGSSDNTIKIAKSYNLKILDGTDLTIGGLRNLGCKEAKGNIFGFLDADCTVSRDWFKNSLNILDNKKIGLTGSLLKIPPKATWIESAWYAHLSAKIKKHKYVNYINSGNCLIRRDVFEEIGGFSEELSTSEDVAICRKIKDKGYIIYNCKCISAVHWGYPKTITQFLNREIWHGLGATKNDINHLWKSKPVLLSIYNILLLFLLVLALFFGFKLFLTFLLFFFLPSTILAFKTSIETKNYSFVLKLLALYNFYGIARTISLIVVIIEFIKLKSSIYTEEK